MKKPIVLAILDGYGYSKEVHGNAINKNTSPFITDFIETHPHSLLDASGEDVGLPKGQIGNSEVGHLIIGAGRTLYTGLSLINYEIENKKIWKNEAILSTIKHTQNNNSNLHILGLLSPGGVHSNEEHIFELIKIANSFNIKPILHLFGDGRDVDPKSILQSLDKLNKVIKKYPAVIASISGRFYAMDRDQRWERISLAYENILGKDGLTFSNIENYIKDQYNKGNTDEFIQPAHLENFNHFLSNNDAVIFANFRPDRARELSHFIFGSKLYSEKPKIRLKNIFFATMMSYDGIVPSVVIYPNVIPTNTLGEVIEKNGLSQLRIAETEKYAHVTFFMDGGINRDFKKEEKILIPSPKVKTYDLKPEMSAIEITDKLLSIVNKFDFVILNYANADMVGHTGNWEKTIEAIKCLDNQVERLIKEVNKIGGTIFITADHGNADEMIDKENNPITRHSTNPVYFVCSDKSVKFISKGTLANVAPTILEYMNLKVPKEMEAKSLLKK